MQGVPEQFFDERDSARFRHLAQVPGVELYHAHISRYAFEPHTHEAFGIGAIEAGAERFRYRGTQYVAPVHSVVTMNPDELHTGEAETADGWRYRMIYLEPDLLEEVFEAKPEVFAHNLETVPRIFKRIRPAFRYERSLDVIRQAHDYGLITKSNLILGMGETEDEVEEALRDLRSAGCDIITITQYLRPGPRFHPIERWVRPEEFVAHSKLAKELGFGGVMSGPLVRSSYRAGRLYVQAMEKRGFELPENLKHLAETSQGATAQEASTLLEKYGPSEETPVTTRMAKTPANANSAAATIR